ncbi:MAG: HEAT repeat domain-containing protein [Phycisphaerales bacterium]|nr:HEAT repeat domain-containing protein [Phycisphaerales bacterium]
MPTTPHRLAAITLAAAAVTAHAQTFVRDGQSRSISTWAAKGLMQNPVAICFDWQGNMYIAETDRAGNAVADTRGLGHLNAVEEDLQFNSVEDRRAQIHRWTAQGSFPPDFFTRREDRVRIVRDADGDGIAETSSVFAGGFNGELDGIGAGVLWHDNSIYFSCIPDLWRLTPSNDPFVAETRTSLSHGYGIRWCFYGHDLHGLTLGPDGRIYFSMGDRGFNITTKEGKHLVGPDRGGVFRCWPDGSELELFYQGLRNPQELAFNEIGELFTGDNNCDSGDLARVVHVVEGGDSGWRQDVQSLESRGPWNREAIWKTLKDVSGPARPAWTLPPMEYLCAGPSGIALYPGTGESSKYEGCLFLVDFYGSGSTVHAFRPTQDGAGFKVTDHVEYYKGVTVTDIAWGYDGRLYMSDWGGGWEPNPNGIVLTVKNDTVHADAGESAAIRQVREFFKAGITSRPVEELLGLLGHRDQRIRLAAQYELASRATTNMDEQESRLGIRIGDALAGIAADSKQPAIKRYHAIWGIGQIARKLPSAADRLAPLLSDPEAEIRAQGAKTLGDLASPASGKEAGTYIALLNDPSPRVRLYAAQALGKLQHKPAIRPLLELLDRASNTDLTLRHAAAYALSMIEDPDQTASLAESMSPAARLGAVMALRLMSSPGAAHFLNDSDATVAIESARAIYDLRLSGGMQSLAEALAGPIPADRATEPFLRRAIEANVYLGDDESADRLAAFAATSAIDAQWRMLALRRLADWSKPLKREGVWGNWADYPARSEEAIRSAVRSHISKVLESASGVDKLASLARELQARYSADLTPEQMLAEIADTSKSPELRRVMLDRVASGHPSQLAAVCESVLANQATGELRIRAEQLLARADADRAMTYFVKAAATGETKDRQRAVRLLGQIDSDAARTALNDMADRLRTGMLSPALGLEVYDAAMRLPPSYPARRLAESIGSEGVRPLGFSTALLSAGGDPAIGRELFLHHKSAECLRCHIIQGNGGIAGPELTHIAVRSPTSKIIESIVEPTAVIASGYGAVSAMPQMTLILTPHEVRDVVAYLATLKPGSGSGDHTSGHGIPSNSADAASGEAHPATTGHAAGSASSEDGIWPSRAAAFLLLPVTVIVTARALRRSPAA